MHDAWYFSVAALPAHAKLEITQYLQQASTEYRADFDGIIDFMNQGTSTSGERICAEIRQLDQRRDTDLKWAIPKLSQLLNYVKNI
jgi:hypothetical protein